MASFFFELLTEEIPARMQPGARENLKALLSQEFAEQRFAFSEIYTFTTPRRIGAHVTGLPQEQVAYKEEIRGPRVGAPEAAVAGFLKSQNLESLDQCTQKETPKGLFWVYEREAKARPTKDVLGEILTHIIQTFPWPKSMRWGTETTLWIRPLRGILALFEGEVVPCEINVDSYKIISGSTTVGHRFLSPQTFEVSSYEDYKEKLKAHYVLVEPEERKVALLQKVKEIIKGKNLSLVEDPGLLEEVTGLVEWPVPYSGSIPSEFMALPREVLTTSMRVHQRYFSLETAAGEMAPSFLFIANQEGSDQGATIIRGNEKVLRARLTDALFFWEQDKKQSLEAFIELLKNRAFYKGLGTLYDKAKRLENLCSGGFGKILLERMSASLDLLEKGSQAGLLAKADLTTQMVGEFPELQGIMGSYYAQYQGCAPEVCEALYTQYKIQSTQPLSVLLALADRVDSLYGFFSLQLFPTGSKDPFGLRRAALGIIQLLRQNNLSLPLPTLFHQAHFAYEAQMLPQENGKLVLRSFEEIFKDLKSFFAERLRALLREEGCEPDSIQASFKEGWDEDIPLFFERVKALDAFFQESSSQALFFAYRRASSILKGINLSEGIKVDFKLFEKPQEQELYKALALVKESIQGLTPKDFEKKFMILMSLKAPLDAFFDHVTVNVEEESLRQNRLGLLQEVTNLFEDLADFSKIEKEG